MIISCFYFFKISKCFLYVSFLLCLIQHNKINCAEEKQYIENDLETPLQGASDFIEQLESKYQKFKNEISAEYNKALAEYAIVMNTFINHQELQKCFENEIETNPGVVSQILHSFWFLAETVNFSSRNATEFFEKISLIISEYIEGIANRYIEKDNIGISLDDQLILGSMVNGLSYIILDGYLLAYEALFMGYEFIILHILCFPPNAGMEENGYQYICLIAYMLDLKEDLKKDNYLHFELFRNFHYKIQEIQARKALPFLNLKNKEYFLKSEHFDAYKTVKYSQNNKNSEVARGKNIKKKARLMFKRTKISNFLNVEKVREILKKSVNDIEYIQSSKNPHHEIYDIFESNFIQNRYELNDNGKEVIDKAKKLDLFDQATINFLNFHAQPFCKSISNGNMEYYKTIRNRITGKNEESSTSEESNEEDEGQFAMSTPHEMSLFSLLTNRLWAKKTKGFLNYWAPGICRVVSDSYMKYFEKTRKKITKEDEQKLKLNQLDADKQSTHKYLIPCNNRLFTYTNNRVCAKEIDIFPFDSLNQSLLCNFKKRQTIHAKKTDKGNLLIGKYMKDGFSLVSTWYYIPLFISLRQNYDQLVQKFHNNYIEYYITVFDGINRKSISNEVEFVHYESQLFEQICKFKNIIKEASSVLVQNFEDFHFLFFDASYKFDNYKDESILSEYLEKIENLLYQKALNEKLDFNEKIEILLFSGYYKLLNFFDRKVTYESPKIKNIIMKEIYGSIGQIDSCLYAAKKSSSINSMIDIKKNLEFIFKKIKASMQKQMRDEKKEVQNRLMEILDEVFDEIKDGGNKMSTATTYNIPEDCIPQVYKFFIMILKLAYNEIKLASFSTYETPIEYLYKFLYRVLKPLTISILLNSQDIEKIQIMDFFELCYIFFEKIPRAYDLIVKCCRNYIDFIIKNDQDINYSSYECKKMLKILDDIHKSSLCFGKIYENFADFCTLQLCIDKEIIKMISKLFNTKHIVRSVKFCVLYRDALGLFVKNIELINCLEALKSIDKAEITTSNIPKIRPTHDIILFTKLFRKFQTEILRDQEKEFRALILLSLQSIGIKKELRIFSEIKKFKNSEIIILILENSFFKKNTYIKNKSGGLCLNKYTQSQLFSPLIEIVNYVINENYSILSSKQLKICDTIHYLSEFSRISRTNPKNVVLLMNAIDRFFLGNNQIKEDFYSKIIISEFRLTKNHSDISKYIRLPFLAIEDILNELYVKGSEKYITMDFHRTREVSDTFLIALKNLFEYLFLIQNLEDIKKSINYLIKLFLEFHIRQTKLQFEKLEKYFEFKGIFYNEIEWNINKKWSEVIFMKFKEADTIDDVISKLTTIPFKEINQLIPYDISFLFPLIKDEMIEDFKEQNKKFLDDLHEYIKFLVCFIYSNHDDLVDTIIGLKKDEFKDKFLEYIENFDVHSQFNRFFREKRFISRIKKTKKTLIRYFLHSLMKCLSIFSKYKEDYAFHVSRTYEKITTIAKTRTSEVDIQGMVLLIRNQESY